MDRKIILLFSLSPFFSEMCLLSDDIYDYHFVSQGKIEIPNVDDGEEMRLTDVSIRTKTQFVIKRKNNTSGLHSLKKNWYN